MTIQELYEWALENKCDNYEAVVQYRDSGGSYSGTDRWLCCDIDAQNEVVVL